MENSIQFSQLGIAEAIRRHRLKVPLNQREYAWELEHVKDLLQDIAIAMSKGKDFYFLGTIVLTTVPQGFLEVADGQQRLATTTMILAAMRDIFLDLRDEMRAQSIETDFLFTIGISARERISKLTLNADDNQFFCTKIISRPKDRGGLSATRRSHELLEDGFREVRQYLGQLKSQVGEAGYADALIKWLKYL